MTIFGFTLTRRNTLIVGLIALGGVVVYWQIRRRRIARSLAWRVPDAEPRVLYPPGSVLEPLPAMPPRQQAAPRRPIVQRRVIGASLILIALLALLYVWWWDGDVTPKAPTLATSTPVPESLIYAVNAPESSLGVKVESGIGTVNGSFEVEAGVIELVPVADGLRVIANIRIDGASLDVGNNLINSTLRRALQLEEYPTGIYSAASEDTIPIADGTYSLLLDGRVELRGVQQEVEVASTITHEGDRITLTALMPIDVTDFGVNVPALLASNILETDLLIVGTRADPQDHEPDTKPTGTPAPTSTTAD